MNSLDNLWKNDKGFIWMLAISIITLISSQLSEGILWESKFIVRTGFFFVTLIAIRSSSLSRFGKLLGYFIAFAILLLAVAMIRTEAPGLNLIYTVLVAGYMIYIITLVFRQIFTSRIITVYQIGGGVAAYILLGHIWASMYLALYIIQPDSFQYGGTAIQHDEALKQLSYFSFVTLTTIGYGDITALGSVARILVMIEGLLGQLFPAIFIAKLVSHEIEDSRKK
ncbi:Ion channel [Chryseolinea serpens]|uniref:Ion channel n=1 Tax=Chryseolinea serpens TaxID=947013 RepID=A0A1M5R5V0_9BACT|nr:potassium channel family protein [Chryseolinea serpens]SHH21581.1 Ion channel [Chryseolinea serpens]